TPQASQIVARPPARRPAAGLVRDEQCGRFATLHRASYQAPRAQGGRDCCPWRDTLPDVVFWHAGGQQIASATGALVLGKTSRLHDALVARRSWRGLGAGP